MTKSEALQHGLGYACGREDSTGELTRGRGWTGFGDAYAKGWDDFNTQRRCMMVCARTAYDNYQASNGATIYDEGA